MTGPTISSIAALLLALGAPAQEQGAQPDSPLRTLRPDSTRSDGAAGGLAPVGGKLELSLDACVRAVLERNLSLRLAEITNEALATGVLAALGSFDPELYASAVGSDNEEPTASSFASPRNHSVSGSAGLRGLFRSGMSYDLGYSMNYSRRTPDNPFFGLNPEISSTLGVGLTQPLLRGFGTKVTEAPVEQARMLVARGDLTLFSQVQETAFLAVEAYWKLVRARMERDTAETALAVSEELVSNNQKRLAAGVMTRLDVLTAQAEAARRKEALILAQNVVGGNEDALKALLSPGADPAAWDVEIATTSEASLSDDKLPSAEEAIIGAFEERADLRALAVDVRKAELALDVATDTKRPQFDLTGSYGYAGLAGNSATSSDSNTNLWGHSLAPIRDRTYDQWSVGFQFSHPIGNRTAEAGERRARLEKEHAMMALLERRMAVVQELRGALRNVADAAASYEAAKEARILAEEQYQAELVRLENEHSTTFQVREVQRDLFQARVREVAAITQYEILRAGLERSRGTLAQMHGVEWAPTSGVEGALTE